MSMLDDTLMDNGNTFQSAGAATEKARSPLRLKSTETAGQLEAYFERNVDDVGTDKGLTCPLYIQELDCAVLFRQTLTPCIVFRISQETNEGITKQALYDLVF